MSESIGIYKKILAGHDYQEVMAMNLPSVLIPWGTPDKSMAEYIIHRIIKQSEIYVKNSHLEFTAI